MWAVLVLMAVAAVLGITKAVKCNSMGMSLVHLVGIPALLCLHGVLMGREAYFIFREFSGGRLAGLIINALMALPVAVMMLVILYRICKEPISRESWDGHQDYDISCARRQLKLLWVVYPLGRIAVLAALAMGIVLTAAAAGAILLSLNPFFIFIFVCTLGLGLLLYAVIMIGAASPLLFFFMAAGLMAFLLIVTSLALGGTMLYRLRSRVRYTKVQYLLKAVSLFVPIWGLVTLIGISRDVKREMGIKL